MRSVRVSSVFLVVLVLLSPEDRLVFAEENVWTNIGPAGPNIVSLVVHPKNQGTIYAAGAVYLPGHDRVFKTTDGGANWIATSGPPTTALAIDPQNPSTIYAGGSRGLFKSTDSGESWSDTGLPAVRALAIDPKNPSVVYAGSDISGELRVFKSTNGGITWLGPSVLTDPSFTPGGCSAGWYFTALAVDPHNPNIVYGSTGEATYCDIGGFLWKSTDGGVSWRRMVSNLYIRAPLVFDPENANTMFVGQFGGMARSTDGGESWTVAKLPIEPFSIAIDPRHTSTLYAAGYELSSSHPSQIWKSIDGGQNWLRFTDDGLGPRQYMESLTLTSSGPKTLYAASREAGVFKIDDPPAVSMDSAQYCTGDSWKLKVSNGGAGASIRLLGTSNGQSWEVLDWRRTNTDGSWSEAGSFAAGTEGRHFLRVDIDGALSNVVSFAVSKCAP